MRNYTPGPWKVAKPAEGKFDKFQVEDRLVHAGPLHICEVYQYRNDENREVDGVALANAQLIACAPRMLELLKELVRWHEGNDQDYITPAVWQAVYDAIEDAEKV